MSRVRASSQEDRSHTHKEVVSNSNVPKKISQIQFGTLDTQSIQKVGEVRVTNRDLFNPATHESPQRLPSEAGPLDARMGVSGKGTDLCKTCGKTLQLCSGHFGYIRLELPVFHAGFFKHTLAILQCVCKRCARVMVSSTEKADLLKKIRAGAHPPRDKQKNVRFGDQNGKNPMIDMPRSSTSLYRGSLFKKVVDACKPSSQACIRCPHCGYANGVVKKVNGAFFKIAHERNRKSMPEGFVDAYNDSVRSINITNSDLSPHVKNNTVINPIRAYELLVRIPREDYELLWMNGEYCSPDSLIMWAVPVPPVPIRPSMTSEGAAGSNEDDITVTIQTIVEMNKLIQNCLERGSTYKMVADDWDYLQIQVALLINGETPGIPKAVAGNTFHRGLCQRLKGKQGRFRGNLSGKRVDFSGRTVISPDPNLAIHQVGVPERVAKIMTYPERVNDINKHELQMMVKRGPNVWPGANTVRKTTQTTTLTYFSEEKLQEEAERLQVGDVVDRHMKDGDVVLFNRQPSLHKMSIMAHEVKVQPWRTFRFNECACTPYNADFDGDEMNLHMPQTEEARAEASELMNITRNLVTPRNGEPLVAATQDFLTGAHLVTQRDVFFTREEFCAIAAYFSDATERVDVPPPCIVKPAELWSGKQLMTIMVRPLGRKGDPEEKGHFQDPEKESVDSLVSFTSKEKYYKKDECFCPEEGFVLFRGGELLSGALGKKTMGDGSKTSLFYVLIRDRSLEEATRCMSRLAKFCARFLGNRGFSIGIEDVTPSVELLRIKENTMAQGKGTAEEEISAYRTGSILLKPGCDALQSLESSVNGLLGKIRETCGQAALQAIDHRNSALTMAQCGSKGSPLNISQMMACLGQQSVGGARIQNGFVNRTLPHFNIGALEPAAKGFVENSFFSGLTATEFFFHTMGGREGLVDTAVKTAETGYMARRLMKALEDLSMQYDNTVRNSEATVVQFSYGDDGLHPQFMESGGRPVDFQRLWDNVSLDREAYARGAASVAGDNEDEIQAGITEEPLSSKELRVALDNALGGGVNGEESEWKKIDRESADVKGSHFVGEARAFFEGIADRLEALEAQEATRRASVKTSGSPSRGGRGAKKTSGGNGSGAEEPIAALRARVGRFTTIQRRKWESEALQPGSQASVDVYRLLKDNTLHVTNTQLHALLREALRRYQKSMVPAGEAVGAIGAQSLSEPGTQMTLKTFHFAGVASMNVTLGVPRLKEIINGSKVISTPIIEARLLNNREITAARIIKAQIEMTRLGEVATYIKEVHGPDGSYIDIKLDRKVVNALHLEINAGKVRKAILSSKIDASADLASSLTAALRSLKEHKVKTIGGSEGIKVRVYAPDQSEDNDKDGKDGDEDGGADGDGAGTGGGGRGNKKNRKPYFMIQSLKKALQHVIVAGHSNVHRAVINEEMTAVTEQEPAGTNGAAAGAMAKEYYLLVEGYGLREVMGCSGIRGDLTKSNHIADMLDVLGIEAARLTIANEINFIMSSYGITVDTRHLLLLADVMTFRGEVLGITRFGVAKMRESVLMLASFEKTTDHLFDAAVHSRQDSIVGVSECIIMGVPIPVGTGLFKLLHKAKAQVPIQPRKSLLEQHASQ